MGKRLIIDYWTVYVIKQLFFNVCTEDELCLLSEMVNVRWMS